jgi:hypothetical protein
MFENRRDRLAPALGVIDAPALLLKPPLSQGSPSIKSVYLVKMVEKIVKEAGCVRNAREWNTLRIHSSPLCPGHRLIGLRCLPRDSKILSSLRD